MEKAKEFLCNTNETIAAIGDRVGYKDSRYFSQTFARQVGVNRRCIGSFTHRGNFDEIWKEIRKASFWQKWESV